VQELIGEATGGPPVNWRVRRQPDLASRTEAQGRALVDLATLVGDVTRFVSSREQAEREEVPLGPALRPPAARALRALAEALRSVDVSAADADALDRAWAAARALADAVRDQRRQHHSDLFEAGTLVAAIERTLVTITP
jgi:hypothetical protein